MEILAAIGTVTIGVLLVILGFNALIIVHEWGHFIVARLCGVRCEKFYIWFDFWGLKFFKFKWGDTEYGLGLFPLGGYVKMLGQEDNPGAIQAEIERAKLQAQTATPPFDPEETVDFPERPKNNPNAETVDFVPNANTGGLASPAQNMNEVLKLTCPIFAPDSYLSKSVPQRLAIIIAGVLMNFLFAIVCATAAYMIGVTDVVSAVGNVVPGSPAWEAGLQTGDRITAIDGKPAKAFSDVRQKMVGGNKNVQLDIDRQGESMTINVAPRKRERDLFPQIGILLPFSLELLPLKEPISPHKQEYYSAEALEVLKKNTRENPLQLEKVDGQIVNNYAEYQAAQLQKIGQPITCTFSGMEAVFPAIPMREIPLRFKMGEIVSLLPDSNAAKQGIEKGDTLVSVDGDADIDPLKLPQIIQEKVNAGQQSVKLVIRKSGGSEQTLDVELNPTRFMPFSGLSMRDPMGSTALGLAWNVEPVIAAVNESAVPSGQPVPAIGDRIVSVELVNGIFPLDKNSFSKQTDEGFLITDIVDRVDRKGKTIERKVDIPYIFTFLLQETQPKKPKEGDEQQPLSVRLTLESPDETTKVVHLSISESTDWFNMDRGFSLSPEKTFFQAAGLGEALSRGMVKTVQVSLLIYKTLNSLINGTVSPKALMGPVGIVRLFYEVAQEPWSVYLMLLCLVGANLAVVNLLPLPPLDGGHIVFLTYEGIFRRPPNELVQVILSYVGLFLILVLMIWTITLDLSCITRW